MLDDIWIDSFLTELIEDALIQSTSHLIDFEVTSGPSSRSCTSGFDWFQSSWPITLPETAFWLILKIAVHLKQPWTISLLEADVWLILKIPAHLK
jgi:hypothetical protein